MYRRGPAQNTQSIWYRFSAPTAGILSGYTYGDDFPDLPKTIVSVHTGACGALAVTFDPVIGATNRDRCAATFFPLLCDESGGGAKLACR